MRGSRQRLFCYLVPVMLVGWSDLNNAYSHGIWCHVHVTGWAIENLPQGELKSFFDEPEVFQSALFGAAFTDSGYWPQSDPLAGPARAYSEHTHWEPFIENFVAWIRANDPPPWTSLESKKRVAFLMGAAAHGLQDELFDSLFLPKVHHHDKGEQDGADPASDGFLATSALIRFYPTEYIPMDALLELYKTVEPAVTEQVIRQSVEIMLTIYLNQAVAEQVLPEMGEQYAASLPWTMAEIFDVEVPGSVVSEVFPTSTYLEALWLRLHGQYTPDKTVTFWYPDPPNRLLSGDHTWSESWVTAVYGIGVKRSSAAGAWSGDDGKSVEHKIDGTRWNVDFGRLHRVMATESLTPGQQYTVTLEPGLERIDGVVTTAPNSLSFQVACQTSDDSQCPPLQGIRAPVLDGSQPVNDSNSELTPKPDSSSGDGCASVSGPATDLGPVLLIGLLMFAVTQRMRRVI